VRISTDDLRTTLHYNERMTVVVLEHQKFLEMRNTFQLHKTNLAFSSLAARRIYLSSRVFRDFDTLLRCITHELGHFAIQSVYEDHPERAAERMRQKARQMLVRHTVMRLGAIWLRCQPVLRLVIAALLQQTLVRRSSQRSLQRPLHRMRTRLRDRIRTRRTLFYDRRDAVPFCI
jgi:hypothetical protein